MGDNNDQAAPSTPAEGAAPDPAPDGWEAFHEDCYDAGKAAR
jgi:hypothetical protein